MFFDDVLDDDDSFETFTRRIYRRLLRAKIGIGRAAALNVACLLVIRDAVCTEDSMDPVLLDTIKRFQQALAPQPRIYVAALGAASEMILEGYGATVLRYDFHADAGPITYN